MKQKIKEKKKNSPANNTPEKPIISMENKDFALDVGNRIRLFREMIDMSREEMAHLIEKENFYIEEIENGNTLAEVDDYYILFKNYGLNLNWVSSGEGRMFSKKGPDTNDISFLIGNALSPEKPNLKEYKELFTLMEIPSVEKFMLDNVEIWKKEFSHEIGRLNDRQPGGHDGR
jgi:transcriptional regulator with XRE-family HTH domain